MNINNVVLSLCLLMPTFSFATERVASSIGKVTVYRQGAIIERTAKVNVAKGKNEFALFGLSPNLDKQSVVMKVNGANLTSVSQEIDFQKQIDNVAAISKLSDEVESLNDSIANLKAKIDVLETERSLMLSNKSIKGDNGLNAKELADMTAFFRKNLTEIDNLKSKYTVRRRALIKQRDELLQKQVAMNKISGEHSSVLNVVLSADNAGPVNLEFSYYVADASWNPVYDVRVDNINNPLQLSYKAAVKQNTKEDWKDVNLVVSTLDPSVSTEAPMLSMNRLYFNNRSRKKSETKKNVVKYQTVKGIVTDGAKPLKDACVYEAGKNNTVMTDANGMYEITVEDGATITFTYVGKEKMKVNLDDCDLKSVLNVSLADYEEISTQEDEAATPYVATSQYNGSNNLTLVNQSDAAKKHVRVRGVSSLSSRQSSSKSPNPLYVVNGMPVDGDYFKNINQEDIVSMEYVKDASSTGIYGNRAPDGVVIVKLKDGASFSPNNYSIQDFSAAIRTKNTILSNGQVYDVRIVDYTIPAKYEYVSIPKESEKTFLVAKIADWYQYNMLSGVSNLYYNKEFKGSSHLSTSAMGDTMRFSFGEDKDIVVKRVAEVDKKSKTLLSKSITQERNWVITVKNNKTASVSLNLKDQFPISGDSEIKVELLEASGAKVNDKSGELSWLINLAPHEEKKLKVSYTVKSPKDKYLIVE